MMDLPATPGELASAHRDGVTIVTGPFGGPQDFRLVTRTEARLRLGSDIAVRIDAIIGRVVAFAPGAFGSNAEWEVGPEPRIDDSN
jgi:hypothetical protein